MPDYSSYAAGIVYALDDNVDYGRWNAGDSYGTPVIVTYSFDVNPDDLASGYTAFNSTQQSAARTALDAWDAVSGVKFVEVDNYDQAQIYFAFGSLGGNTAGLGDYPYVTNSQQIHAVNFTDNAYQNDVSPGSFGFEVILHELGHNLGLKHPHESNAGVNGYDSTAHTVMSYVDEGGFKTEPQGLDIAAIQLLYGTQADEASAPWTYDAGSNTATYQGSLDADNLVGSGLHDMLRGSQGNDTILGNFGDDTIRGGKDNDYIEGGDGANLLYGDIGSDTVYGGDDNDRIDGGRISSYEGQDADYLVGWGGDDYIQGNLDSDTIWGMTGNDTLRGGRGDDYVNGYSGDDILYGDRGDDQLNGGDGSDTAVYRGNRSDFSLTDHGSYQNITDNNGVLGTDVLQNIEFLQFDDGTFSLSSLI
ncbi:matrixin family metalloprotease [Rhodovibrionaceae bacterium A322]